MAIKTAGADPHHLVNRRQGEQATALPVQVACENVEDLDRPLAQGTEALGGYAHAAIADSSVRSREIMGHGLNDFHGHPGVCCSPLGGQVGDRSAHGLDPVHYGFELTQLNQSIPVQHVDHGQQQRGIGSGPHRMIVSGQLRCFGSSRIDHHQFAAPPGQGFDALAHVGHGPNAAIGCHGVGPQHQKVIGPVDVGNGEQQLVPEQPKGDEMVG